jgi:hypothetical protein
MSEIFESIPERIEVLQIKHDISKMECEMQYHQGMTKVFEENLCQLQSILEKKIEKLHIQKQEESV